MGVSATRPVRTPPENAPYGLRGQSPDEPLPLHEYVRRRYVREHQKLALNADNRSESSLRNGAVDPSHRPAQGPKNRAKTLKIETQAARAEPC
jgi:hypothetical protein